ncbi:PDDEXK nuclease domain-containing protein [Mycobacterium sp. HUMS_1102779]|uniref:PDDEXK nuclease domain-containing protein n=1 Tax=Mycobacterium sp. HUMS_1102779 TaxID=3383487 RepID=UPI00389AFC65
MAHTDHGENQARFPAAQPNAVVPDWYPELLSAVANRVQVGRHRAVAAANQELVATYWGVGKEILARQDAEGWGARVIDRLACDLNERFPDTKGFSPRNLKYMRAFAAAWSEDAIVQAPLAQLPWYHHITLVEKLGTSDLRLWYAGVAVEQGWSRNVLVHHIDGQLHQRAGRAVTNFADTMPPPDSDLAQQATRDPYLFDFVGIADIRRERDLEQALTAHVEKFLLELGQGFAFVGRQVHLEIGDADFYADLLFYHLRLRCFVVIELKVGDFDPSYLGQLGMYMSAVDDLLRHPEDRPTIGLVLCKTKNNVVAEYALRGYTAPIGVAEWKTAITASLPPELETSLPTVEELEAELDGGSDEEQP